MHLSRRAHMSNPTNWQINDRSELSNCRFEKHIPTYRADPNLDPTIKLDFPSQFQVLSSPQRARTLVIDSCAVAKKVNLKNGTWVCHCVMFIRLIISLGWRLSFEGYFDKPNKLALRSGQEKLQMSSHRDLVPGGTHNSFASYSIHMIFTLTCNRTNYVFLSSLECLYMEFNIFVKVPSGIPHGTGNNFLSYVSSLSSDNPETLSSTFAINQASSC